MPFSLSNHGCTLQFWPLSVLTSLLWILWKCILLVPLHFVMFLLNTLVLKNGFNCRWLKNKTVTESCSNKQDFFFSVLKSGVKKFKVSTFHFSAPIPLSFWCLFSHVLPWDNSVALICFRGFCYLNPRQKKGRNKLVKLLLFPFIRKGKVLLSKNPCGGFSLDIIGLHDDRPALWYS